MANPPPGPRAKIERAKKHLKDLQAVYKAFHESNPYTVVTEADPEGGWLARIKPWPPNIPVEIPLIFGDLIHNLRAALDILICDLIRDHWPQHLGDGSGFPVFGDANDLIGRVGGKVKGARNTVQQAVVRLKPYKGGNDALWKLHRLDILDKHRLIIPAVTANQSVNVGRMMSAQLREATKGFKNPPAAFDLWIKPAAACDDEGGIIFRDRTSTEPQHEVQFKMLIAVHEPGLIECEPILELTTQLGQSVEAIVKGFDVYFK